MIEKTRVDINERNKAIMLEANSPFEPFRAQIVVPLLQAFKVCLIKTEESIFSSANSTRCR